MKSILIAVLAAAAMAAAAVELPLVKNGASDYVIVIPEQPPATDVRAAEELQRYLKLVTGAELSVVAGEAEAPFISVGRTAQLAENGGAYLDTDLGEAGYAILPLDGSLYLWGGSRRGALNAVYALLEEDVGIRMYTRKYTFIPETADLTLNLEPRYSLPAFPSLRDPLTMASLDVEWSLFNRAEPLWVEIPEELGGRHTHYSNAWISHSYDIIVPASELNTSPECFAMTADGGRTAMQRCPSNPEFRRRAIEYVRKGLAEAPGVNHAIIGMCDNYERCHCPDCSRVGFSAAHYDLINEAARAVRDEFPEGRVATLAYIASGMPPEGYVPEPNVTIWLATDCVPDAHRHIPAAKNETFAARMAAWAPIAPELQIWDYHVTYINNFIYDNTLYAMQENLKYFRDHGVDGVQIQGPLGSGGEREALKTWAFTKLMWDPDLSFPALIDDYCYHVFGKAAEPVRKFYQELYLRGASGRTVLDWGQLARDEQLRRDTLAAFEEAYRLADGDPEIVERLDLEFVPGLLMQLDYLNSRVEDPAHGVRSAALAERAQRLEHLNRIIEREQLIRYQMEGRTADLLTGKNLWDFERFPVDMSADALLIPGARAWIWRWTGPGNVRDDASGIGMTLSVPYTPNEYPIRWHFDDYPTLKKGGRLALKLRLRADRAEGEFLEVGTYSNQRGFQRSKTIAGTEVGGDYRWVDAGTVELEPNAEGYIYIRAVNPGSSSGLYVDAVVVQPVK